MESSGLPSGAGVKNWSASAGDTGDAGLITGLGRSPGVDLPTLVFLPEKSHGQRNLMGHSRWGHRESAMTEATRTQ